MKILMWAARLDRYKRRRGHALEEEEAWLEKEKKSKFREISPGRYMYLNGCSSCQEGSGRPA
jgi:hypothetical protein